VGRRGSCGSGVEGHVGSGLGWLATSREGLGSRAGLVWVACGLASRMGAGRADGSRVGMDSRSDPGRSDLALDSRKRGGSECSVVARIVGKGWRDEARVGKSGWEGRKWAAMGRAGPGSRVWSGEMEAGWAWAVGIGRGRAGWGCAGADWGVGTWRDEETRDGSGRRCGTACSDLGRVVGRAQAGIDETGRG